ncbi:hypothetical protein C2E23DRAFT_887299 [Lenzites betulinus]|nr:hypothetical protein C2E23DRAFT_887299 [Lenzites betulinus]
MHRQILNVFAAVIFCFTQSLFGRQFGPPMGWSSSPPQVSSQRDNLELLLLLGVARSAAVMIASALLAGALIHRLRSLRSFTDFRKTDHRIKALITYTSNTGLLIGISSLLSLIFALAWPQGQVCIAIDIVATQLYAVSLLTELNCSREYVYTDGSSIITETVRSPSVLAQPSSQWVNLYTSRRASRGHHMSAQSSSVSSAGINIKVTKTTEIVRDDGTAEIHLKGVL